METKANIYTLSKNPFNKLLKPHKQDPFFDLSLIINNSEENLLVIDQDYKIIMCNHIIIEAAKEKIGIDLEIGDSIFSLVVPEEQERVRAYCDRALAGEKLDFDYSVKDRDGNSLYFNNVYKPVRTAAGDIIGVIVIANDITEKTKAYQSALETEQRWRFALEGSTQGVWDWNIITKEIYFSPSWKKMLGYEESEIKNCLATWENLVHPEDKEKMQMYIAQHFVSNEIFYETEQRLKAKDGNYRWILSCGMIVERSAEGKPLRMIGTHTDITERKNIEEGYNLLFYKNPLPMWTFDRQSLKFLSVNDAAVKHYGYSREEFLAMTILDIRPVEDQDKVRNHILNNPGETKFDERKCWRHKKKNGDIIFVNLEAKVLSNKFNSTQSLVLADDITEQIVAEEKLKQSELLYRTLFRSNPLPSLIYDSDTFRFLEVNDAAVNHYGYSYKEFSQITLLDLHLPQHHEALKNSIANNPAKTVTLIPDWKQVNKAGDELVGDISASSLLYNGLNARLVVINDTTQRAKAEKEAAQNVTERKRLEQELLRQELDKQKFISQATIDTQEQERREIGKELHDNVNQVLTTTKLYLDLSLTSPDSKDELIQKSSKNIIYVINEIRQLSRSLMDPSIGDLGLLDSINDLVENINITRKLHVSLCASPDLEKHLDESQKLMIFRVIQEAMNNTIKYAQATSVQLNLKTEGGNLALLIADDGKGFDITTVKKGAGLKNIQNRVYLTGGNLLLETAPGKGCKIIINFPINNKIKSE